MSRHPLSGFAYVCFAHEGCVEKAVAGTGIVFQGRELEIRLNKGYVSTQRRLSTEQLEEGVRPLGGRKPVFQPSACGQDLAHGLHVGEHRQKAIADAGVTTHVALGMQNGSGWIWSPEAAISPSEEASPLEHSGVSLVVEVVRRLGGDSRNVLLAQVGQALNVRGLGTKEVRQDAIRMASQSGWIIQGGSGTGTWVRLSEKGIQTSIPSVGGALCSISGSTHPVEGAECILNALLELENQGNGPQVLCSTIGSFLASCGMDRVERAQAFDLASQSPLILKGGGGDKSWMMLADHVPHAIIPGGGPRSPHGCDELWLALRTANALEFYTRLKEFGVDTAEEFAGLTPDDLFMCGLYDLRVREAILNAVRRSPPAFKKT